MSRALRAYGPPSSPAEYVRVKTGRLIPCPGEAHSNPHIDNCGTCAPRWGTVEELEPVDLDAARAAGLDVPCGWLTDEQANRVDREGVGRIVRVERKTRYGRTSYCVVRWPAPVAIDSAGRAARRGVVSR